EVAKTQYYNEEYDAAISALETMLEEDMSHAYFEEVKRESEELLEAIKKEKEAAIQAAEEEEKKQKEAEEEVAEERKKPEEEEQPATPGIGEFAGYWLNTEENIACHMTSSYMACAMPYSDFITH